MKRGKVLVEQVLSDGSIVKDYDTSLSPAEMTHILCQDFPNLTRDPENPGYYLGEYQGQNYAIRCKNVTYLGNPHPIYKKRIQIADDLQTFCNRAYDLQAKPLLLGLYSCQDHHIFVNYQLDTYLTKKAHNSSAHVYTSDLYAAVMDGYFQKIDSFGNSLTVFRPDIVSVFLEELFTERGGEREVYEIPDRRGETTGKETAFLQKVRHGILPVIRDFFAGEPKHWNGITCYQEMIAADYKNKFQPEWVGFYLEFALENYIREHHLEGKITYHQDKTDGGIDLDLYFPELCCYGDLKAHSEASRGIQGNDWDTVFALLDQGGEKGHLFYIVCEHTTEKDSQYDYEVTRFWNTQQGKENLMSYHKRMKHDVTLKRAYLLDIHAGNREYLTMFKQGINSNGKPRAPKIMIEQDNLKHFMIEEIVF